MRTERTKHKNRIPYDYAGSGLLVPEQSDQAHAGGHLLVIVALDQRVDPVVRIQKPAEAAVMVQGGDDEGNILAHIRFNKPFGFGQLRLAVGQVG